MRKGVCKHPLPVVSRFSGGIKMKKINSLICKIEEIIGSVMLLAIIALVFLSAVLRVFRHPVVWSVDTAQLLFVWICMFGADLALKKGSHMGVDMLVRKFPVYLQKGIAFLSYVLCIAFVIFMSYWGVVLCVQNYLRKYTTLGISYSFSTGAIPFVSVLMLFTLIERLMSLIKNWKNKNVITEEDEAVKGC